MITPGLYRHHKGGLYTVLFVATESTNERNGRRVVVYVSLTTGALHTRDEVEFEEPVSWPQTPGPTRGGACIKAGTKLPRFTRWPEPEVSR